MQSVPTAFKAMYAGIPNGHQADQVSKTSYVTVTYVEGETPSVKKFLVQHDMIASSGDKDMDTWSRKRKLFPWAAVAAPIDVRYSLRNSIILPSPHSPRADSSRSINCLVDCCSLASDCLLRTANQCTFTAFSRSFQIEVACLRQDRCQEMWDRNGTASCSRLASYPLGPIYYSQGRTLRGSKISTHCGLVSIYHRAMSPGHLWTITSLTDASDATCLFGLLSMNASR